MPKRKIQIVLGIAALCLVSGLSESAALVLGPHFVAENLSVSPSSAESSVIADVTGDGLSDVIISTRATHSGEGELLIYPQLDDGSLGEPTHLDAGSGIGKGLAAGDLNNDEKADIAMGSWEGVLVYHQGTDGLEDPVLVEVPEYNGVNQVEIGDGGGDEANDIVAVFSNDVFLLTNEGSSFAPSSITSGQYVEMEFGDVTGDNKADLVGAFSLTVSVFPQLEGGGFGDPVAYSTQGDGAAFVRGLEIGDVNNDSRRDVIALADLEFINVFAQNQSGTLDEPIVYESEPHPLGVESGDINGDDRVDVVTFHPHSAGVYSQNTDGSLEPECVYSIAGPLDRSPKGIAIGDANSDGMSDLVLAGKAEHLSILRQADHVPSLGSIVQLSQPISPVNVGDTVHVSGRLSFTGRCGPNYSEAAPGQHVTVARTNPNGSETTLPATMTDDEGEFAVTDSASTAGTISYRANFEGDSDFPGDTSDQIFVQVDKLTTSLFLRASPRTIRYGKSVRLAVHLPVTDTTNRSVSIFATPRGESPEVVATGNVDGAGDYRVSVPARKHTTFYASWDGDDTYQPTTSVHRPVSVRAETTLKLSRHYDTAGKYRLYREGRPVFMKLKVAPNHAGKKVILYLDFHRSGEWRRLDFEEFRLGGRGSVRLSVLGLPAGYRFRVKAEFRGDADHLGDESPYAFFKVTR